MAKMAKVWESHSEVSSEPALSDPGPRRSSDGCEDWRVWERGGGCPRVRMFNTILDALSPGRHHAQSFSKVVNKDWSTSCAPDWTP